MADAVKPPNRLPPPDVGSIIAPPTPCPVYWGEHFGEHLCCISVEEHYGAPDWHECDCGSQHQERDAS